MPHIVIEYFTKDPLDKQAVLQTALDTATASGVMERANIKVRLLPAEAILLGDGRLSFMHVTISLLAGRSDDAKLALAQAMTAALRDLCPQVSAISADIRDMNPYCYKKSLSD
ncbi:MAG: hypothetical protein ABNH26_11110 [Celeribacter sp.]|jgi:5-carboxymethyl-2-hydroxymuconate isomerase